MNISALFIHRPVGTTLLTVALALVGVVAYQFLPVSPLPQVEFPTIEVTAGLPGASPETMSSAVTTPLERQLGRIGDVFGGDHRFCPAADVTLKRVESVVVTTCERVRSLAPHEVDADAILAGGNRLRFPGAAGVRDQL